jgi:hypothetical protein
MIFLTSSVRIDRPNTSFKGTLLRRTAIENGDTLRNIFGECGTRDVTLLSSGQNLGGKPLIKRFWNSLDSERLAGKLDTIPLSSEPPGMSEIIIPSERYVFISR